MEGCDEMIVKDVFIKDIEDYLELEYSKTIDNAKSHEKFTAIGKSIMKMIGDNWSKTQELYNHQKQAYYLSAEYLMGRALGNNLMNLNIYDEVKEALNEIGINLNVIEEVEEDAGLGNGGLGRLAACFLESSATLNLPLTGYGIRYEYGIFKQRFENGFQIEEADNWLKYGDPWSVRRDEDAVIVQYSDCQVKAIPYDTPIIGYGTQNINTLRLWKSEAIHPFVFKHFNEQKYDLSVAEKNRAEDICRVLYPNDSNREGKLLRLRQQYFFVAASVKDLVRKFKKDHGSDFNTFPDYHTIQLNDTHPVVAIPELMRLLMDEEGLGWDNAWDIAKKTFAYTNHTIMEEALEKWDIDIFRHLLPRIYEIIEAIDHRFLSYLQNKGYHQYKINSMKIIIDHNIHMARLAIHGSYSINGVAHLHTEIIKHRELKQWHELYPNNFINITNGVTPRRWMLLSNTELANFISKLLGSKNWITNLNQLKNLEKFQDDEAVLNEFMKIKHNRKVELAEYIKRMENIDINPDGIFDIQIKRLHEYKRQLLNALHIVYLYFKIKDNPSTDMVPRTFIFGAKAAPGYERAKGIIKYINEIARVINEDHQVNDKIKVAFVQNYNVSYAQKLFPAADISEQISTAGKEASGTGNMKFMLNGTPTVGTFDGANVEIVEEAGWDNNFIFGATVEELEKNQNCYDPRYYYENIHGLRRVVESLIDGTFKDQNTGMFRELYDALICGQHWHPADHYFVLKDFESYIKIQEKIEVEYRDTLGWAKKCWINLSNGGKFSSDRSIDDYAKKIWHIQNVSVKS